MDDLEPHRRQQTDVQQTCQDLEEDEPAGPAGETVRRGRDGVAHPQGEDEGEKRHGDGDSRMEQPQPDEQVGRGREVRLQGAGEGG
ncbi:MAG TPA: hypothetical protein VFC23_14420, partial [Thermoanaerobaculia bacterium]|nr:hypothetical protein [Thermoanaerobaculia bacterium]